MRRILLSSVCFVPFIGAQLIFPLLSESTVRQRRLQLPDNVDQLYQGPGTHYVDLWVGCPPQRQTVIVDTGSSAVAFPCLGCERCGGDGDYHIDRLFDQDASSCFQIVGCDECVLTDKCSDDQRCQITRRYSEGSSWLAFEAIDQAYTGGTHDRADEEATIDLHFGCQTSLTGLFEKQWADGIMGMKNEPASYWRQLYAAGRIDKQQFSLCFTDNQMINKTGTPAGLMVVGGSLESQYHTSPLVYADMDPTKTRFELTMERMYLRIGGGDSVKHSPSAKYRTVMVSEDVLNTGGVIVDSGTTITYFPSVLAAPFADAWKQLMGRSFDPNAAYSESEIESLPTLLIQFRPASTDVEDTNVPGLVGPTGLDNSRASSILVAVPPISYLDYDDASNAFFCMMAFDDHKTTLGANFMRGKDVLFDVDHGRMGFAESRCEYSEAVETQDDFWSVEEDASKTVTGDSTCSASCRRNLLVTLIVLVVALIAGVLWKRRRRREYRRALQGEQDDGVWRAEQELSVYRDGVEEEHDEEASVGSDDEQ